MFLTYSNHLTILSAFTMELCVRLVIKVTGALVRFGIVNIRQKTLSFFLSVFIAIYIVNLLLKHMPISIISVTFTALFETLRDPCLPSQEDYVFRTVSYKAYYPVRQLSLFLQHQK